MCDINIILSVITGDQQTKEQFVLSTDENKITFPNFIISDCNDSIEENIIYFINHCFNNTINVNNHNLFLISIDNTNINNIIPKNNTINIVYGMIIPKYTISNQYFWKKFTFNDLSIPDELSIIGETIRRGF